MYSKSHEMASLFNERDFSRIFKVLWQTVGHLKIDFWNQSCHVQKCKNNEFFVCFSAKCLSLVTLGLLSKVATRLSKWVGPPKLLFLRMLEAIKWPHFSRGNSLGNLQFWEFFQSTFISENYPKFASEDRGYLVGKCYVFAWNFGK